MGNSESTSKPNDSPKKGAGENASVGENRVSEQGENTAKKEVGPDMPPLPNWLHDEVDSRQRVKLGLADGVKSSSPKPANKEGESVQGGGEPPLPPAEA